MFVTSRTALRTAAFVTGVAAAFSLAYCQSSSETSEIKLNQIQVIGTHNSYHAGIAPNEAKLWQAK